MNIYNQLTYEQRCNISILKKIGYSQHMIADEAGISQLTISSWFKRNTGQRSYRENKLKGLATIPSKTVKAMKMTYEKRSIINSKMEGKWSPKQISLWLNTEKINT